MAVAGNPHIHHLPRLPALQRTARTNHDDIRSFRAIYQPLPSRDIPVALGTGLPLRMVRRLQVQLARKTQLYKALKVVARLTKDYTMTSEEVFDTVLKHLRTQGVQCMENCECAYRNAEGLKCAIGVLLDDEDYDPIMEGRTARELQARFGLLQDIDTELLSRLQHAHDTNDHWNEDGFAWRGESYMAEIAEIYGLLYCPRDYARYRANTGFAG